MDWLIETLGEEWFAGFISGLGATLIGFILTIAWDLQKLKRDENEKKNMILKIIDEELKANKKNIEWNTNTLDAELGLLEIKMDMVGPLLLLKTGFWEVLKIHMPLSLLSKEDLGRLRSIIHLAEQINETIRSRENYRINNLELSGFRGRIHIYNHTLLSYLKDMRQEIESFEKHFQKQ